MIHWNANSWERFEWNLLDVLYKNSLILAMTIYFISIFSPTLKGFNIYLFKVNNINTRRTCEICSKLTIKTPQQNQFRRSGVFIFNCEYISHLYLLSSVSIVDFEQVNVSCDIYNDIFYNMFTTLLFYYLDCLN